MDLERIHPGQPTDGLTGGVDVRVSGALLEHGLGGVTGNEETFTEVVELFVGEVGRRPRMSGGKAGVETKKHSSRANPDGPLGRREVIGT